MSNDESKAGCSSSFVIRHSVTLDLGPRTLDLGPWTSDLGPWTLDLGPWTLDLGPWTLDLGPWTLDHPEVLNLFAPFDRLEANKCSRFKFGDSFRVLLPLLLSVWGGNP